MDRHPSNGGSGIVECDLPQWCKTRIGPVMIHKASTSPPHTHVRVGETPDRSCDSSLASRRQSSLCHSAGGESSLHISLPPWSVSPRLFHATRGKKECVPLTLLLEGLEASHSKGEATFFQPPRRADR